MEKFKKQLKNLHRSETILKVLNRKELRLIDLKIILERERNKPAVNSFLFAPEIEIINEINNSSRDLFWLKMRYNETIKQCFL
jgi:hypothetical protein